MQSGQEGSPLPIEFSESALFVRRSTELRHISRSQVPQLLEEHDGDFRRLYRNEINILEVHTEDSVAMRDVRSEEGEDGSRLRGIFLR